MAHERVEGTVSPHGLLISLPVRAFRLWVWTFWFCVCDVHDVCGELRAQQLRRRVRGRPRGSRERRARQWPRRWRRRRIAVAGCGERCERESDDRKQSDEREPQWPRL